AWNFGDLAVGIAQDIDDALRIALDGGGAVTVAADAERILTRDLHQIGGLPEHARNLFVLHEWGLRDDSNRRGERFEGCAARGCSTVRSRTKRIHYNGARLGGREVEP